MAHQPPRYDIADIVRAHRGELEAEYRLSRPQKRVLTLISLCRTAALGGHVEVCSDCGKEHHYYHSCRDRHCPKCQAAAQQAWIDQRSHQILPVQHFHLVFTLASELRSLARQFPEIIYNQLFQVTRELLLQLGRTRMKATLGLTMVLHTWTRDLRFHPHLHVLATAGGLSVEGSRFVHVRRSQKSGKRFLFHVDVMGKLLRGKMLDALRRLYQKGSFPGLDKARFDQLMTALASHKKWVVYAKEPFQKAEHVLSYLGRYTHRVGIANSRLLDLGPTHVTFRTKGKATVTLHPVVFLRRFLQHILPPGFHKIRHAGLYAQARDGGLLCRAKALLPKSPEPAAMLSGTADEPRRCSLCHGLLMIYPIGMVPSRAPPTAATP